MHIYANIDQRRLIRSDVTQGWIFSRWRTEKIECVGVHTKRLYFSFNYTTMKSNRPCICVLPFILLVSATASHPFSASVHVVILLLMRLVDSCLFCTASPPPPHPSNTPIHLRVRSTLAFEHIKPLHTYTFSQIFNQLPHCSVYSKSRV